MCARVAVLRIESSGSEVVEKVVWWRGEEAARATRLRRDRAKATETSGAQAKLMHRVAGGRCGGGGRCK